MVDRVGVGVVRGAFGEEREEGLEPEEHPRSGGARKGSGGGGTETREHLANERTLLSWVRTGVGLISIGLVVERTGALAKTAAVRVGATSASELFGLALALLGVLTLVMGTAQFLRNRQRISAGDFVPSVAVYMVVVSGSLAFAGAFVVYVLLT